MHANYWGCDYDVQLRGMSDEKALVHGMKSLVAMHG